MATKVHETTKAVDAMRAFWWVIDALLGGTAAMRAAGVKLMPKRRLEEKSDYEQRLATATLFPAYAETSASLSGRVFFEPLVQDKIDEQIKKMIVPDVNKQGQNLDVFASEVFKRALDRGLTFILVESPRKQKPDGSPIVSQADEEAAGIRPYALHIDPMRVLGWQEQDGVLMQIRILFCQRVPGDFGEVEKEQIRVYDKLPNGVQVRIFERIEGNTQTAAGAPGEQFAIKDTMMLDNGIKDIPIICFYTNRTGFFQAKPPLMELAYLNVKHWQKGSSNDSLIATAEVPILAAIGWQGDQEGEELVIGAKSLVEIPLKGDLKYVEIEGTSIQAGQKSLENLKDEMKEAGAKLLIQASATKTATQSKEESIRENSQLGQMARNFNDFLTQLLDLFALFLSKDKGGEAKTQPNLDPEFPIAEALAHLTAMNAAGKLSDQTLFEVTKEHGWLPEDLSWEDEQERIKNQPEPASMSLPTDPAPPKTPEPAPQE